MNDQTVIESVTYFRSDLELMTREQLRAIARKAHSERNSSVSRTWLGSAAQSADLIAFILGNEPRNGFAFASTAQAEPAKPVQGETSPNASVEAIASLSAAIANFLPKQAIDRNEVESIVAEQTEAVKTEVLDFVMDSVNRVADELTRKIAESAR